METEGEKSANDSQEDFPAGGTGKEAKDFNKCTGKKHQCSRCLKVYRYRTTLQKHIPTCRGKAAAPFHIEAQAGILQDALRCTADIKREYGIIGTSIEKSSPVTFETANSRLTTTEVYTVKIMETGELQNVTVKIETQDVEEFQTINDKAESQARNVFSLGHSPLWDTYANPPQLSASNVYRSTAGATLNNGANPDEGVTPALSKRRGRPKNKINQTVEEPLPHSSKCNICFKTFKTVHSLRVHLIQHTSRFKCEHCSKTFQGAFHLEEHIQSHLGIKRHQCTVCGVAFTSSSNLRNHMRTHSGERHKCDTCGRAFYKKSCLEDHMNVHRGTRPYQCTLCPKSYASRGSLWIHKNSYH